MYTAGNLLQVRVALRGARRVAIDAPESVRLRVSEVGEVEVHGVLSSIGDMEPIVEVEHSSRVSGSCRLSLLPRL